MIWTLCQSRLRLTGPARHPGASDFLSFGGGHLKMVLHGESGGGVTASTAAAAAMLVRGDLISSIVRNQGLLLPALWVLR